MGLLSGKLVDRICQRWQNLCSVNECEIIPDEDIYILEKKEVIEMINERIREEDEMYGIPDGMEAWEGGERIQALHYYITPWKLTLN